jgi:hypothetical protein
MVEVVGLGKRGTHWQWSGWCLAVEPMVFPPLPNDRDNPWPANILAAHSIITESCRRISDVLRHDDLDPVQVNHYASTLTHDTIPMLQAIEDDQNLELPRDWLRDAATYLGELLTRVLDAAVQLGETG